MKPAAALCFLAAVGCRASVSIEEPRRPSIAENLIERLADDCPEAREAAEKLLEALGEGARSSLAAASARPAADPEMRWRAARLLLRLDYSKTLDAALEKDLGAEWIEWARNEIRVRAIVRDGWDHAEADDPRAAAWCAREALRRKPGDKPAGLLLACVEGDDGPSLYRMMLEELGSCLGWNADVEDLMLHGMTEYNFGRREEASRLFSMAVEWAKWNPASAHAQRLGRAAEAAVGYLAAPR